MTAALYIHIPFCEQKCGYCDFYSLTNSHSFIPSYLNALKKEINLYSSHSTFNELVFATIYLGGGTPSLLQAEQVASIIEDVLTSFQFIPNPEITVEANPGTTDTQKLQDYRTAGVNRLSLGVQSFQPDELKLLERIHTVEDSITTYEAARNAGFENISFDLIFALPYQTMKTWKTNLEIAAQLGPEHISAYNLTFEKDTPFEVQLRKEKLTEASEEVQREMHLLTIDYLQEHGFYQYEISNYAKSGFASLHNQKYWDGSHYLGLGPSSHSYDGKRRFWNFSNLSKYIHTIKSGERPIEGEEHLDLNVRAFERVFLGLRQMRGINFKSFEDEMGFSFFDKYLNTISKLLPLDPTDKNLFTKLTDGSSTVAGNYLAIEDGFLRLTKQGILLCDSICSEFNHPNQEQLVNSP